MSDERPVYMPRELADPWLKLPALTRALGRELYCVYERRVIGVELDEVEDVLVRMLGPKQRERKAVRSAIRSIVDAGLLVPVEGGVRLLCHPYDWEHYGAASQNGGTKAAITSGRKVDRRGTDRAPTDDGQATDPDRKGDGRSTDPDRKGDAWCTEGVPTPQANHAETLRPDPIKRERSTDQEPGPPEATRGHAREPARAHLPARTRDGAERVERFETGPELDDADAPPGLDADEGDRDDKPDDVDLDLVRDLVAKAPRRFRALYMERFRADPTTTGQSTLDFPERLARTAQARGRAPLELLSWAFSVWADQGRPGAKDCSPWAAFVARFDRIVEPAPTVSTSSRAGFLPSPRDDDFAKGTEADEVFT